MLRRDEPDSHDRTAATTLASISGLARCTSRAPSAATSTAFDPGGGSAAPGDLNRVDVKVEKLTAEPKGGLRDFLGVAVGPDCNLDVKR